VTADSPPLVIRNETFSEARFVDCYLDRAVMRGVDFANASIDGRIDGLVINGVEVAPLVEAELNRRFPGRAFRGADDVARLRDSWSAVRAAWVATLERALAMPEGTTDRSVDGEWSFAQTLRHLVMATDAWLGKSVLQIEQPFHPLGVPYAEYESDGFDMSIFTSTHPTFAEVLQVRAERQTMVADFLETATPALLGEPRRNPWSPEHEVTVGRCLRVVLNEEWEHLRFATRDLDVLDN
jgi:hypothetical protein